MLLVYPKSLDGPFNNSKSVFVVGQNLVMALHADEQFFDFG
jgi:hypothetical protein